MENKKKILLIISIFIFILIILDRQFFLFPQVEYLYQNKVEIKNLIYQKNVHIFRYLVVYIPIFFSNMLNINVNILYTLYLYIVGGLLFIYSDKIYLIKKNGKNKNLIYIFMLVIYLSIYFIVNGRILFSYLGEVILIYEIYSKKNRKKIYILAIFFASVSSGTMLVIIFSLIMYFMKTIKIKNQIGKNQIIVLIILVLIALYAKKMILKNLHFFDNNIFKVLEHGIFSSQNFDKTIILSWVYTLVVIIFGIIIRAQKDINRSLLVISLLFGLFGKTTFTMVLIPFCFEIGFVLNRVKWRPKQKCLNQ